MAPAQRLRFANLTALHAQLTEATWKDLASGATKVGSWYPADKVFTPFWAPYPSPPVSEYMLTSLDMSIRAIETVLVLECDSGLPLATEATTAAVWAACEWFVHASDRLWKHVKAGWIFGKNYEPWCGEKYARRDWRGFERGRWDVWEARLAELEAACTDVESKARLHNAMANMRRARMTTERR